MQTTAGGPPAAARCSLQATRHGKRAEATTVEVLTFGAVIVFVVLGLHIIAGMMGIFNFAHGAFVLLGGYTT